MLKLSHPHISDSAIIAAVDVIKSGALVQGKNVLEFENKLSEYLKIEHVICVSSGTAALHLSLLALNIQKDDEVIVPAFTFPATANVVEVIGATTVLADININDYCIDYNQIRKKITKKTKAIIPVHEFGQPAQMDKIIEIASEFNLKIIEDAACALGAEFISKKIGTFGDLGCFSLHPRKAITTGEGGIICTNNDVLASKIRSLRNHGIQNIDGNIDFIFAGLNYRLTDFQAVLGTSQLIDLDSDIDHRIKIAQQYNRYFNNKEYITFPETFDNRKMVYQTYHVLLDNKINRKDLIKYLTVNGIETNLGAQALNSLSYYVKKYNFDEYEFPNATNAFYNGLALPIGNHITFEDVEYICTKINTYYNEHSN
jgi:perosamine synthetase